MKGRLSRSGYRHNSKDVNNDFNIIPSNVISMNGVNFPIHGLDDLGNHKLMLPGEEHMFPGNFVLEIPDKNSHMNYKKKGGGFNHGLSPEKAKQILIDGHVYGHPLTASQRNHFSQIAGTDEEGNEVDTEGMDEADIEEMKYGGIHIAKNKRGTFTAAATKHGKGVQEFASQVLANPGNYSPAMVKKANFARNASKWKHQMGGPAFTIPTDAQKVLTAPTDMDSLGTYQGKTYYKKEAATAIPGAPGSKVPGSPGTINPNPEWKQSIIKMLQSGVPPEELVNKGHISPSQLPNFKPYYKAVYTETPSTTPPVNTPIKTNPDAQFDRKPIFTGTQPYQTYQYPDVNAGYGNPNLLKTRHFYTDPKTKTEREIDPLKSYDQTGKTFTPSFLYGEGDERGTAGYGTLKNRNLNTGSIIPDVNYSNPNAAKPENVMSSGFAYGGEFDIKKFIKNYIKKLGGSSSSSPQGETMDNYLDNHRSTFTDFLKTNAIKHIMSEDIPDMYYQFGGGPAWGPSWQNPNQVPSYVPTQNPTMMDPNQTMNTPYVTPTMGNYNFPVNNAPVSNTPPVTNTPAMNTAPVNQGQKKPFNSQGLASGILGTMDFFSNMLEQNQRRESEKRRSAYMNADNVFQVNSSQNRGNVDTNTAMFRPNNMGYSQNSGYGMYKHGGAHKTGEILYMDLGDIDAFLKLGGQIEILD